MKTLKAMTVLLLAGTVLSCSKEKPASQAVSHILDLNQLLDRILELIFGSVEADRGCVMVFNAESGAIEPKALRWRDLEGPSGHASGAYHPGPVPSASASASPAACAGATGTVAGCAALLSRLTCRSTAARAASTTGWANSRTPPPPSTGCRP